MYKGKNMKQNKINIPLGGGVADFRRVEFDLSNVTRTPRVPILHKIKILAKGGEREGQMERKNLFRDFEAEWTVPHACEFQDSEISN